MREHQRVRRRTDESGERESAGRRPERGRAGDGEESERSEPGERASEVTRAGERSSDAETEGRTFVLRELSDGERAARLSDQPESRTDPQHVAHQQQEPVVLSPEPTYAELQARMGEAIRISLEPTYRELQARSSIELDGWCRRWLDRTGAGSGGRFRGSPGDDAGGDGLVPP